MNLKELHLHCGQSCYKGKKYRLSSLNQACRQNGRNRRKSVVKLGNLKDEVVKSWRSLCEPFKNPIGKVFLTIKDGISAHGYYRLLKVTLAGAIWNQWRLPGVHPNI